MKPETHTTTLVLLVIYTLLLIYGTLFPITDLHNFTPDWNQIIRDFISSRSGKSDLITNAIIYLPFGYLLYNAFMYNRNKVVGVSLTFLIGFLLSASLEFTQIYLPSRTTSLLDLILNSAGALIGGLLALSFSARTASGRLLYHWKKNLFVDHYISSLALVVVLFWAFSHIMPLVPGLSWSFIKDSLKPILHTITGETPFDYYRLAYYALSFSGIGVLLSIVLKRHHSLMLLYSAMCAFILIAKIIVISRQLSLEAISGVLISIFVLAVVENSKVKIRATIGLLFITAALLASELAPVANGRINEFIWLPFVAQMRNVMGMVDMVVGIWPYMCIAFFVSIFSQKPITIILGGAVVATVSISLEYMQTFIPGRYPDITDILIATSGWFFYFFLLHKFRSENR